MRFVRPCAHGENAAELLHNAYVVDIFVSRLRPADVFKAAGHELLPVKIIRRVPRRFELFTRIAEHFADGLPVRQRRTLGEKARALFERERVHRDILGPQRDHLAHRVGKALRRIAGETRDEIHVEGELREFFHHRHRLLRSGVVPPDLLEHRVRHRLRVDAHAVHAVRDEHRELFLRHGVRPPGLDGELPAGGKIKARLRVRKQPVELRRRERRGRAAADVYRNDAPPGSLYRRGSRAHLLLERVEIIRDALQKLRRVHAHRAAIGAARRAERDADVQAHVLRRERRFGACRGALGGERERRTLFRHTERFGQHPHGGGLGQAVLLHEPREELCRTHTGKAAPLRLRHADVQRSAVEREL